MNTLRIRTLGTILTACILLALLAGCGPKNGIVGDPVKGMTLQYALQDGQALSYKSETTADITMEQMGQTINIVQGSNLAFTLTGKGEDAEGNFIADFAIDDFAMTMEGIPGMQVPDVSSIPGHVLEYTFTPQGKRISLNDPDSVTVNMGPMSGGAQPLTGMIQSILANLPEDVKKIGDTWTETRQDTSQRMSMDVFTNTETKYTIAGQETVNDYACLKIVAETTGTVDGSGETQGMQLTMEGDLETTATTYFAYKEQKMVKQVTKAFSESTVIISGPQNMTQPVTTESTTTIELVK